MKRILVAGIGNIFMGDDGFGSEVARQLHLADLPQMVDLVDFGIRGMDLGYALTDGYDVAILIDAVQRGGDPGTVYVIEPEFADMTDAAAQTVEPMIAPHAMDPAAVLRFVAGLGHRRPRVLLVGGEPESLGGEDGRMGLSAPMTAAAAQAVREVQILLRDILYGDATEPAWQQRLPA